MAVRGIVFDFGNVVGYFSHRKSAEQLARYSRSRDADFVQKLFYSGHLEIEVESGRLSVPEIIRLLRAECDLDCTDDEVMTAVSDMFWPNGDVCGLLPLLRGRYGLALLSNTNALHAQQFLVQFQEELSHFDHLVLSHEVGMRKPAPEIFEYTQKLLGVPAKECVFIDDIRANVDGARACGWHGIVYERGMDLLPHLQDLGVEAVGQWG